VLEASTALRLADTAVLARSGANGARPELEEALRRVQELLYRTAVVIDRDHFLRLLPQRSLLDT
jgi:hypothetical protein